MSSLLSQFSAASKAEQTPADGPKQRSGKTRSEAVQEKYKVAFGNGNTVAKGAALLGISHVACLNQFYRYESKKLMSRLPERDTETGGLIIRWGVPAKEVKKCS